ncbi:MAG: GTP 3',8-cyclase MoaA [Chloroflexota bacterium]|nr:GTP 3',8-cyclase MoaA [Chloroflexota bacterium]
MSGQIQHLVPSEEPGKGANGLSPQASGGQERLYDSFGRGIDYLRISLTDACNLRCVYCMPEDMRFRHRCELLQDDEILTIVQTAAALGVRKIRLTGGEPTVRPGVIDLVQAISSVPGIQQVAMTTNGVLLAELAEPLARAGLRGLNVSIDTLDPARFRRITRWGELPRVWDGIAAAEAARLAPIKLNCVVTRGFNDDEVVSLARLSIRKNWHIRFIELMPMGSVAEFQQEAVVPSSESRARIEAELGPLHPASAGDSRDPARTFRLPGASGLIGFISTVTEPFCAGCNRIRLTADGKLRLCLLRDREVDLLTPMREGCTVEELTELIRTAVWHKPWGHGLPEGEVPQIRVMSQIGG